MSDGTVELAADVAYAAAEARALKTTKALILAEGQILTLQQRVRELEALTREQRAELQRYFERDEDQARGEVTHDAAQIPDEAFAGAEAGAPHPFSD
jgi:glutamate mutase epsilon subunit